MAQYGATLAYDGTAFQGFQRQPIPTPTIQATVEAAITAVTGQVVGIVAAGRTDAGVHAVGQVVAFEVEWRHSDRELLDAINSQLPPDIALQRIWPGRGFHPRYDALWRQYAYKVVIAEVRNPLLNRQAWQLTGERLDIESMREGAAICLGEHDFAAFGTAPQQGSSNTIRDVYVSRWETKEEEYGTTYTYRIRGTAFLYHMVRRLVGTMVQLGKKKLAVGDFKEILMSRDLQRAKVLAPPNGLVLESVHYPEPVMAESTTRANLDV